MTAEERAACWEALADVTITRIEAAVARLAHTDPEECLALLEHFVALKQGAAAHAGGVAVWQRLAAMARRLADHAERGGDAARSADLRRWERLIVNLRDLWANRVARRA